jgi:hypothetical protein
VCSWVASGEDSLAGCGACGGGARGGILTTVAGGFMDTPGAAAITTANQQTIKQLTSDLHSLNQAPVLIWKPRHAEQAAKRRACSRAVPAARAQTCVHGDAARGRHCQ